MAKIPFEYMKSITGPTIQQSGSNLNRYPTFNFVNGFILNEDTSYPRLDISFDTDLLSGSYLVQGVTASFVTTSSYDAHTGSYEVVSASHAAVSNSLNTLESDFTIVSSSHALVSTSYAALSNSIGTEYVKTVDHLYFTSSVGDSTFRTKALPEYNIKGFINSGSQVAVTVSLAESTTYNWQARGSVFSYTSASIFARTIYGLTEHTANDGATNMVYSDISSDTFFSSSLGTMSASCAGTTLVVSLTSGTGSNSGYSLSVWGVTEDL